MSKQEVLDNLHELAEIIIDSCEYFAGSEEAENKFHQTVSEAIKLLEKKLYRVYVTGTLGVDIQAETAEKAEEKIQQIIDDPLQSPQGSEQNELENEHLLALDALQGRKVQAGGTEEL